MDIEQLVAQRRPWVIAGSAAVPLALCAAVGASPDSVPDASAAVALVVVIVAASATGIRAAGLCAAVSSAAWFDFFLTQPYRSFAIDSAEDVEVAVLLLAVGLAVTELALWGQRQRADLGRQRGYLDGVMATAESVAQDAGATAVTNAVADRIREVLDLDRCEFVVSTTIPGGPLLERDGTVTRAGSSLDVDRGGLPIDSVIVLPVRTGSAARGYFRLTAASHVARPTRDQRRVAVLLADQVAALALSVSSTPGRAAR
jgi:K+-sensing histidine kinase KdpD